MCRNQCEIMLDMMCLLALGGAASSTFAWLGVLAASSTFVWLEGKLAAPSFVPGGLAASFFVLGG